MNLLEETHKIMKRNNKHPNDISFIGSSNISEEGLRYYTSWAKFIVMADREYNASYGGTFVALDLIIEFNDGSRMYRHEYDGAEGWVFSSPCVAPATETLIEMESPFAISHDSISGAHREGYWDEEYHKKHLCPQDGCNNFKNSWEEMCNTCYEPIRAKKEEERRKDKMNFSIKHRPMETWRFKEMFDAEALGERLKQVIDEQQNELAQEESNTTPYLHLTNTRFVCNNSMNPFQPFIDVIEGDEEE